MVSTRPGFVGADKEGATEVEDEVPAAVRGIVPAKTGQQPAKQKIRRVFGTDSHLQEIRLETAWQWADLTYLAGGPAAGTYPWPYNRSVVARVYLPLVVRKP